MMATHVATGTNRSSIVAPIFATANMMATHVATCCSTSTTTVMIVNVAPQQLSSHNFLQQGTAEAT